MNRSAPCAALADDHRVRALVVGSPSARTAELHSALAARQWVVTSARDPDEALRCLSDDLDGFDLLLVTAAAGDACDMLVRTVRRGGEAELAIVVVTCAAESAAQLERAGADAVLDRSLGVELIARASDAVLSRKRVRHGP